MAHASATSVADRKAKIKARAEAAVQAFLDSIQSGRIPETVGRITLLSRASDAPSAKWSAGNQALMVLNGTADARGIRQWNEVGRWVKKGAKAFYIFVPILVKKKQVDEETGEEVEREVLVGFTTTPVFRYEDTEGKPIAAYQPPKLPPLVHVAKAWGVDVKFAPTLGIYAGYYAPGKEEIVLCTPEERVFFHELAHAAHYRLVENAATPDADTVRKEIVAETAAAALCHIYGIKGYEAKSLSYIAQQAKAQGNPEKALREIMRWIGEVKAVVELILATAEELDSVGAVA